MKTIPSLLAVLSLLGAPIGAAETLPEEARKLVEKRTAEVHKIDLAYAQALDAMLVKYKAAGKDVEARAVEGLIAAVEGKKAPAPADEAQALAALVGVWQNDDGGVWKFTDATSGIVGGKHRFTMSFDVVKRRVIVVGGDWVNYLTFTADNNLLNGTYEKGGRSARFKLNRIK